MWSSWTSFGHVSVIVVAVRGRVRLSRTLLRPEQRLQWRFVRRNRVTRFDRVIGPSFYRWAQSYLGFVRSSRVHRFCRQNYIRSRALAQFLYICRLHCALLPPSPFRPFAASHSSFNVGIGLTAVFPWRPVYWTVAAGIPLSCLAQGGGSLGVCLRVVGSGGGYEFLMNPTLWIVLTLESLWLRPDNPQNFTGLPSVARHTARERPSGLWGVECEGTGHFTQTRLTETGIHLIVDVNLPRLSGEQMAKMHMLFNDSTIMMLLGKIHDLCRQF